MKIKNALIIISSLLLLILGCSQKETNGDDMALLARVDTIGKEFVDSSSVLRILIMDSTGHLIVNSIVGDDGSATPNDELAITTGDLMFPILLASLGDEIDTSTLMLKAGKKEYNGVLIADGHFCYDHDSLPVMQALDLHSHVAQTELGWIFYHDRIDIMKERIRKMLPGVEFINFYPFENDSDFLGWCDGCRLRVPLTSLLKCYSRNDVAAFVHDGCMISWQATEVDRKESDICIGYSPDRRYTALIIVSQNPMPYAVFDKIFRITPK